MRMNVRTSHLHIIVEAQVRPEQVMNELKSYASRETFLAGLKLYHARPDKGYSLTDCISMETMRREGLTDVLTNDRHSEQEGFRALFRSSLPPKICDSSSRKVLTYRGCADGPKPMRASMQFPAVHCPANLRSQSICASKL